MGTVLLSAPAGHWRYAHINAVRLAMYRIEETAGLDWPSTQILDSISPALGLPWILDIDVTVKPPYSHQQGAEIGYNPQKPGRRSQVYHSCFVANRRISPGVEVRHTTKVKDLVTRMMRQGALWQDCGDGWQALESSIRLSGCSTTGGTSTCAFTTKSTTAKPSAAVPCS